MAKFLVETVSTFRMRYAVDAKSIEEATQFVKDNVHDADLCREFSQEHVGELVTDTWKVSDKEYLKQFDIDNDYLSSWTDEQKFDFVNKIK